MKEIKNWYIHIDFDSFFATVEQQANPRLRGKPIGVTGGDRLTRTVIGAASIEAKARGVKTAMRIPEALKICPDLILVRGDSYKYMEINKRFLNILKSYTDKMEVFSIDEVFLEIESSRLSLEFSAIDPDSRLLTLATDIKERVQQEGGEWLSVSIGISYNKMLAKLAGSMYKPNGLVGIMDQDSAIQILDQIELDDVCGIGLRIKARLNNMGIYTFKDLREVPLQNLLASFKSYGQVLYNFARGIDERPVVPYFEKEEVKSVGHRHTISKDVSTAAEIKQYLLKLSEMVARRLRAKNLEGKTISLWYRAAFNQAYFQETGSKFYGEGMQSTVLYTNDGMEIFNAGWKSFRKIWTDEPIRMIGISVSNLKPATPATLSLLDDVKRREVITRALDNINNRYGEFTLQRGVLLTSAKLKRMPNSFMSDRRFRI